LSRRLLTQPPAAVTLIVSSLALFVVVASASGNVRQLTIGGLTGLLDRMVPLALVAIGQTFVIIAGSIDLSVADLVSVAAVTTSFVMQGRSEMIVPGCVLALAIAAAIGAINGGLIAIARVNPFIATLGMGLCLQGLLSTAFSNFAGSVPHAFEWLAYGFAGPVQAPILLVVLLTAAASLALRNTRFGAHLYGLGGNRESARQSGVAVNRALIGAHVLSGLGAGVAGVYLAARLGSGAPWIGRDGVYDLQSIAVAVIGGTALAGGRGGPWGSFAGALLFATLDASFTMLDIASFLQHVLRGGIVVAAVAWQARRIVGHVA
jgi:ribose transport system permease protein